MSAEPGVRVRRVLVGVPSAAKDGRHLDSALQALLAQSQALQLIEAVPIGGAVNGRVAENDVAHAGVKDCRVRVSATAHFRALDCALERPGVSALVVDQARRVVTLVQILEDAGEDFGVLVGKEEASIVAFEELLMTGRCEEGRVAQYVFVGGKQSFFLSHHNSDDGGGESGRAARILHRTVHRRRQLRLHIIAKRSLDGFGQLANTVLLGERALGRIPLDP